MRVELLKRRYSILLVGTSTPLECEFEFERHIFDDGFFEDVIVGFEIISQSQTVH
jgi:hypothetical protein